MALVIVHKPGKIPRLGHTIGDEVESVRKWRDSNPDATIYVVQSSMDLPNPGTAWVQTADELLASSDMVDHAMEQIYYDRF